jgi:hypothetical protein
MLQTNFAQLAIELDTTKYEVFRRALMLHLLSSKVSAIKVIHNGRERVFLLR